MPSQEYEILIDVSRNLRKFWQEDSSYAEIENYLLEQQWGSD